MHFRNCFTALLVLALGVCSSLAEAVHPRLFFTSEDIPALRERLDREPFRTIFERILEGIDYDDGDHAGYVLGWQARCAAFAYILTGDTAYAEIARERVDALRVNTEAGNSSVWHTVSSRQLSLSQGTISVAMAYDFCHDAWDPAYREEISADLMAQGSQQFAESGPGWNGSVDSNWWGIRYSGAAMAFLATDEPLADTRLDLARDELLKYVLRNLSDSPLSRGAIPEGMGYTMYPWQMIAPFLIADRVVNGEDMSLVAPGLNEMPWWPWFFALRLPWVSGNGLLYGLHPAWQDDGTRMGSGGEFALAFPFAPSRYQAGLKWKYDRFRGLEGDQTFELSRAGCVWAYLFYPDIIAKENPSTAWGLNYVDRHDGLLLFRNRFLDGDDILTALRCRSRDIDRRIHNGPDFNGLRIWGLGTPWIMGGGGNTRMDGQSTVMRRAALSVNGGVNRGKGIPEGTILNHLFLPDGSGFSVSLAGYGESNWAPLDEQVADHVRRLLVDHGNPSGGPLFAIVADTSTDGELWRINTPEYMAIDISESGFSITDPAGNQLLGEVHYPLDATIESGTFDTGSRLRIGDPSNYPNGQNGYNNRYLDVRRQGTTDFLISLRLVPTGSEQSGPPVLIENSGNGIFQTLAFSGRHYTVAEDGFEVPAWELPALPGQPQLHWEHGGNLRLSFFKAQPETTLFLESLPQFGEATEWTRHETPLINLPSDTDTGLGHYYLHPETEGSAFFRIVAEAP